MTDPHEHYCHPSAGCGEHIGLSCLLQDGHRTGHQIQAQNLDVPISNVCLHRVPCRSQCCLARSLNSQLIGIACLRHDQHSDQYGLLHSSCSLLQRTSSHLHAQHSIGSHRAHSSCSLQLNNACHPHGLYRMGCFPRHPWYNQGVCISCHHHELCRG
jgi:hypothetical protein